MLSHRQIQGIVVVAVKNRQRHIEFVDGYRWLKDLGGPGVAMTVQGAAKQPDEKEAVRKMLAGLDGLRRAAADEDWPQVFALMSEGQLSPEDEAALRRMLREVDGGW